MDLEELIQEARFKGYVPECCSLLRELHKQSTLLLEERRIVDYMEGIGATEIDIMPLPGGACALGDFDEGTTLSLTYDRKSVRLFISMSYAGQEWSSTIEKFW